MYNCIYDCFNFYNLYVMHDSHMRCPTREVMCSSNYQNQSNMAAKNQ